MVVYHAYVAYETLCIMVGHWFLRLKNTNMSFDFILFGAQE